MLGDRGMKSHAHLSYHYQAKGTLGTCPFGYAIAESWQVPNKSRLQLSLLSTFLRNLGFLSRPACLDYSAVTGFAHYARVIPALSYARS